MVGEQVGAAVVSFHVTVQVSKLVVELVDGLDQGQDAIEIFKPLDCLLVSFGFESVIELGGAG